MRRQRKLRWDVDEVLEFYGEYIESREEAEFIMGEVRRLSSDFSKMGVGIRMRAVRDWLMEYKGIKDIPFTRTYERME